MHVRRISWRKARELRDDDVLVTAMSVQGRETPVNVHVQGAIFYNCPSQDGSEGRKWYGKSGGSPIEFVRPVRYGFPIGCSRNRFLVRPHIVEQLQAVSALEFAPATCVGLLDIDPLDSREMQRICDELVEPETPASISNYIELFGTSVKEADWSEVLAPTPDDGENLPGSVVAANFEALEAEANDRHGVRLRLPREAMFKLAMLPQFGMVSVPTNVMSLSVADIIVPHLPPPFWIVSYWEIAR